MQVKVFSSIDKDEFEEAVNSFLADPQVSIKDLKFTVEGYSRMATKYAVIVLYEKCVDTR